MAADENGRGPSDEAAQRLLDAVGLEGFEYYSAGDERARAEALERWPLLRGVVRLIDGGRSIRPRILERETSE